jgi:hypothetical protein
MPSDSVRRSAAVAQPSVALQDDPILHGKCYRYLAVHRELIIYADTDRAHLATGGSTFVLPGEYMMTLNVQ